MARKVTLVTGQWADLPLVELLPMVKSFGYDGVELCCWGDHFDVDKAATDQKYCDDLRVLLDKHDLGCWAISHHLAGQLVCDPNDERSDGFAPDELAGDPEAKRAWAIETMKNTARKKLPTYRQLLGVANAKTTKGEALGYLTGILYLAPHKISGRNVCAHASKGCAGGCLYTAGMGAFSNVQAARIAKTKEFHSVMVF